MTCSAVQRFDMSFDMFGAKCMTFTSGGFAPPVLLWALHDPRMKNVVATVPPGIRMNVFSSFFDWIYGSLSDTSQGLGPGLSASAPSQKCQLLKKLEAS